MQINALARRLLKLVFVLSSSSTALTRPRLERRLDVSTVALNQAVEELSRFGLLDAQRLRLTLSGLACAVAVGARSTAKRRAPRTSPVKSAPMAAPITLFSQREAPRAVA
jgi:hypothetical protein